MLKHTLSGGHQHSHLHHPCATAKSNNAINGPRKPRSQSQSSAETSSTNAIQQHQHQTDASGASHSVIAAPTANNSTVSTAESRRWYHNQSDGDDTPQSAATATTASRSRRRNRSKGGGGASDVSDTFAGRGKGSKSPATNSVGGADDGEDAAAAAETSSTSKMSRRRPPSGAESAVRRWNSFHSTRGECHPNKFRRDRKATSPSIEVGVHHRRLLLSGALAVAEANGGGGAHQQTTAFTSMGLTQKAKLMRGRSLATSETVLLTMTSPGGGLHGMQHRRYSQQQRAASVWYLI